MNYAVFSRLLPATATSIALCAVMVYLNWQLTLVLASVAPLIFFAIRSMRGRLAEGFNSFRQKFTLFSKGTLFILQMMDLTRIQTAEDVETQRQRANLKDLQSTSAHLAWLRIAYTELQNAFITIPVVHMLMIGGRSVAARSMTMGGSCPTTWGLVC